MSETLTEILSTVSEVREQIARLPDGAPSKFTLETLLVSMSAMAALGRDLNARIGELEAKHGSQAHAS